MLTCEVTAQKGMGKMRLVRPAVSSTSSVVRLGLGLWIGSRI